jgi:uncharacterized protein (TIGR02611 family)
MTTGEGQGVEGSVSAIEAVPLPSSRGRRVLRTARKGLVAVVGTTVVLIGVALIVLPGPAVIVIPLGVAILATEFLWARSLLGWIRSRAHRMKARVRQMLRHGRSRAANDRP